MAYGRQQLLWQKQVTVIGFILDSQIDERRTIVAQFQHVVCRRRSVRRQRFAPVLSLFAAAVGHSINFSVQLIWVAFYHWTE